MKRRIRKGPLIALILLIICLFLTFGGIKAYKYYTSLEYKLGEVGYSDDEISSIIKLDKKYINYALTKYDNHLISLSKQKYFLWKNYKGYISYINKKYKNEDVNYEDVILRVNTRTHYDDYTKTSKTDISKGNGMLVNKHFSLPDDYTPDDIVQISNAYAYGSNSIKSEVYEAFKEMAKSAKEVGITLLVTSSYRSSSEQKEIYDNYEKTRGKEYADKYAARPNFSEHQTGLALDIFTPGARMSNFEETEGFKWLSENSYKFGFILRYPKEKEDITRYSYEAWHYRYLGKDLALKVFESGLTYDEYYAYYLDK